MDPRLEASVREAQRKEGVQPVSIRFSQSMADQILRASAQLRCTRSEVVRACVAVALGRER